MDCTGRVSPNVSIQSRFYNGWTHDHYVTNLLGFTPAGTISVACMNVPGSIHDSTVAEWGEVYDKLEKVYEKKTVANVRSIALFVKEVVIT